MGKNDRLKVLLVSPLPPPVGGITNWTLNVFNYFKNQDQIELCYVNTVAKYRGLLELGNLNRFIAGIKTTIDIVMAIKKAIIENNPSVIHLTSSASLALFKDFLILRTAKKLKTPVIFHWHFGRIPNLAVRKNWEWRLIRYIIRKSDFSIVIDNHSYKALIDKGFKNITYIGNPVSENLSELAKRQKNLIRHIESGKVVFVGHVYVNKGIFELVTACVNSPLVKQLKLIGPVKEDVKIELETMAKKREDGRWLRSTGSKSSKDIFSEISTAELLVLPSYTEGFPYAIIEAMSLACPVVATNVGAIPEMLNINSDSPAGLCVNVKDTEELKASIEKILSNRELNNKYGQNGVIRVLENFTIDKIFKEYQVVWQKVAENKKY